MRDDWPIKYKDLSPYYDKVERLVGVFGLREGIRKEPDGQFLPPPKPHCYARLLQQAYAGPGIPVIPSRLSILTRAPILQSCSHTRDSP